MRDHLRRHLSEASRSTRPRRRGAPCGRSCGGASTTAVAVEEQPSGYAVLLDGRPVRTPARADACGAHADSWRRRWRTNGTAQREVIDPAGDAAHAARQRHHRRRRRCARRGAGRGRQYFWPPTCLLSRRQSGRAGRAPGAALGSVDRLGARRARRALRTGRGHDVRHAAGRGAGRRRAAPFPTSPGQLGAVSAITSLTGSALIALALAQGHLSAEDAWAAAHVDEDWNMHQWGRDEQALERRAAREAEMQAAALVLRSLAE